MFTIFGVPSVVIFGQVTLGLINGSFYALLSLGLAIIFGLLNVVNFAHGSIFMVGAFVSWMLLNYLGIGYWGALVLAPIIVALLGVLLEQSIIKHVYKLDHTYGLLVTFGLALLIEGIFRQLYGISGQPYPAPTALQGGINLGFMVLPVYRAWVLVASILICAFTWFAIEKTRFGSYLRAATENPKLVQALGINVPLMITLTFAFGSGLAALAGVMAAPIYQVSPNMGANLIITVFAVVVVGGMGSILGAIISGFLLGFVEGITKIIYPEASNVIIFVVMALVLLLKPNGLFGRSV